MGTNDKLPVSAIVVGFNEGHLIKNCLESISFCDEILFFDLGSSDNTLSVIRDMKMDNIQVFSHDRVPFAEYIHYEYKDKTKYDWILTLDPDENISDGLRDELIHLFENGLPDNTGNIIAPWIFYFKNKKLLGTPWGGINKKGFLFHRCRIELSTIVHADRHLKNSCVNLELDFKGDNFIFHFWMQDYKTLFGKHLKYLKFEPESRYKKGIRTSRTEILKRPFKAFNYAFWKTKGYKNKHIGFFLSLFWAWYDTSGLIGLYSYQKKEYKK